MSTALANPTIEEFDPNHIAFQMEVIKLIRKTFDYSQGALEVLLSGSIGSAKSLLLAHLIATHAIDNPGAGILVGRRVLKDLKNTIWAILLRHCPLFYQYWNKAEMKITLPNKSVIYGVSWDDGRYDKFRSYELSMAVIEELTENRDYEVYEEIYDRLGRCPRVYENLSICATNPDSPSHWAYEYFIENQKEDRKVFYSLTEQNPFLPDWYIKQKKQNMDPKRARRMLYGEWIELTKDVVYYNYDETRNFLKDKSYQWSSEHPICLMHDFNIGKDKPMSAAAGQIIDGVFHVGKVFISEGARTADIMEDIASSGVLDLANNHVYVYGDATGRNNDTRSLKDDYDIIEKFLSNYKRSDGGNLEVLLQVPKKNPPIRRRQNIVNAYFLNDNGDVRLYLYKGCKRASKGFRLTDFKGTGFVEDDTLPEQHVTTAIGYWIDYVVHREQGEESEVIQL